MSQNGISGSQMMLAFLAGAVTGAAVALLATPKSGADARQSIRGWATDAQGTAGRVPDALRVAYARASVAAKDAFTQALREEAPEAEIVSDLDSSFESR